ncbi:hypothetical protein JL721_10503 [Aureococcus anophagefferens]|nr:hypothetical protein JL721_10503 [Aureococcus anophagefferens]
MPGNAPRCGGADRNAPSPTSRPAVSTTSAQVAEAPGATARPASSAPRATLRAAPGRGASALVVAGAVGAACYAATRPSGGAPVASLAVDAASSSSGEVGVRITNAYGAWDAGTLYPWAHVVEPFRDTKFQVASDETCAMTLAHVDGTGAEVRAGEAPFAITTLDEPNAMTAVFTRAAGDYVLKVTCDDAGGGAPKARTINLKAKHARRDPRRSTLATSRAT